MLKNQIASLIFNKEGHMDVKIQQSKDFSKFIPTVGQRPISHNHLQDLVNSIKKDNRLHLHPIIVYPDEDKNYLVIDGQHRLAAAKLLNLTIHYVVSDEYNDFSLIDDQISKNWKQADYLNYYVIKKLPTYLKYMRLIQTCGFPASCISFVVLSGSKCHEKFRKGQLTVTDQMIDFFETLQPFYQSCKEAYTAKVASQKICQRTIMLSLWKAFRAVNKNDFKDMLEKMKKNLLSVVTTCDMPSCFMNLNAIIIGNKNSNLAKKFNFGQ